MFDYKIVSKPQFTVEGYSRKFNSATSYEEIPKFWHEIYTTENLVYGMYGVCYGCDADGNFSYMIADLCGANEDLPDGLEVKTVPAHTWAVFPCRGALPKALQTVNTYIFSEWLPNSKQYRMAGDISVEAYFESSSSNVDDDYSEIWIPVEEII